MPPTPHTEPPDERHDDRHNRYDPPSRSAMRRRWRRRRRHGGLECLRERGRGGKAIRRYFGESLPDYLLDSRWHRLPHGAEPWHGVHRLARRDGMRRGRHERGVSRQHLVQHTRETIDVASPVESGAAGGLLGAHVARRADRNPRPGQLVAGGGRDCPPDPEVRHDRFATGDQDVFRLDVPMYDVVAVGVAQGACHFAGDSECLLERQLALPFKVFPEGFALDVRHHVVQEAVGLAGVDQRQDVGVVEASGNLDLSEEPLRAERAGELGLQHLDGDETMVLPVLGEVDGCHPPVAELALDRVPVGEGSLQTGEQIGQARARRRGAAPS